MSHNEARPFRRSLLRAARVGLLGAGSLLLVTACSTYTTTGSGGTTGRGPDAGASSGAAGGGLVSTPSGSTNSSSGSSINPAGSDGKTAGPPGNAGGTLTVPTPAASNPGAGSRSDTSIGSSTSAGPNVPRNDSGTPLTAGSGAAVATNEALNPGGRIPVTYSASPVLPTATATPSSGR